MPSNRRDAKRVKKNSDNDHSTMSPDITVFSPGLHMVKRRDKHLEISKRKFKYATGHATSPPLDRAMPAPVPHLARAPIGVEEEDGC